MKYYILSSLSLSLLLFFSCTKNSLETIPVESSFEAPEHALLRYEEELASAPYGWEFGLATKSNSYFAGYLDFSEANTAQFTINLFAPENVTLQSTAFNTRVYENNPVLAFPSGVFAQFGQGQIGVDTVFTFQAIRQDTIYLLGNRHGSQLILTPASLQQSEGYREGTVVNTLHNIAAITQLPRYFKRLVVNGADYDLHFRPELQTLYIHYGGTQRFKIHETLYAPTATGVSLQKPLVDGINVITYLDALEVDLEAGTLSVVTNGISRTFTNEYTPSAYDVTAAQYFFNNPPRQINLDYGGGIGVLAEGVSVSRFGFTVAGVQDAYGLDDIEGFNLFMLVHRLSPLGYGAGWLVVNNTIQTDYGPAFIHQFSDPAGNIRFQYQGVFGPPPESAAAAVNQTIATLVDPNGFFVVSAGTGFYDLVSLNVGGGQKWINFQ